MSKNENINRLFHLEFMYNSIYHDYKRVIRYIGKQDDADLEELAIIRDDLLHLMTVVESYMAIKIQNIKLM